MFTNERAADCFSMLSEFILMKNLYGIRDKQALLNDTCSISHANYSARHDVDIRAI